MFSIPLLITLTYSVLLKPNFQIHQKPMKPYLSVSQRLKGKLLQLPSMKPQQIKLPIYTTTKG